LGRRKKLVQQLFEFGILGNAKFQSPGVVPFGQFL
jgi:hypothetical protein